MGVVVQGKGEDCGPACYLLKTFKVKVWAGSRLHPFLFGEG